MGIVLDSSILIATEKGTFDADRFLKTECATEIIYLTSITATELLHGWERAPPGRKKKRPKKIC